MNNKSQDYDPGLGLRFRVKVLGFRVMYGFTKKILGCC